MAFESVPSAKGAAPLGTAFVGVITAPSAANSSAACVRPTRLATVLISCLCAQGERCCGVEGAKERARVEEPTRPPSHTYT